MSKIVDFDQFRAEQNKEPVLFKIGGETYELSPSLPASIAVEVIALQKTMSEDDDVPLETLEKVGIATFGSELWLQVLDKHRIGIDELAMLIGMILEAYAPGKPSDPQTASTPAI